MTKWTISGTILTLAAMGYCGCGSSTPRVESPEPAAVGAESPAELSPARDYLGPGEYEDRAYGAFGYVLFGRSPVGDPRAVQLLKAWLELPMATAMVDGYHVDPDGLMQVLLPCSDKLACNQAREPLTLAAGYDVTRSRAIALRNGISFPHHGDHLPMLIVLSTEPIAEAVPQVPPTIVDFSGASDVTIVARFRDLMDRVGEPTRWGDATFTSVVADLHDVLNDNGEALCWISSVLPTGAKILSLVLGAESNGVCLKRPGRAG